MNKIQNLKNQIRFYFKKYGFWATLKKCIYRLFVHTNLETRNANNYKAWIDENEPNEEELEKQRNTKFKIMPKISIVVPMYNTKEVFFKDLITCMQEQTYSNWELCLADASEKPNQELEKYYKDDKRIKYKKLKKNLGIPGNTNEGLKMVTGEYVGLLDHDDVLPVFCLYEIVKCINENPDVEFIYTDEDKLIDDWAVENRNGAYFKPDFSPDTLSGNNYITHFVVMTKELMVDKLKGFRDDYNGAQDFDLVLRASEETKNIVHISKVLYHWRIHIESTAMAAEAKPWAYDSGRRAAEDHIKRLGLDGVVTDSDIPGYYRIDYKVKGNPKVNIIIPNKDGIKYLKRCVDSILEKSTYDNYEIDIIENNSEKDETFEYYKEIEKNPKINVIEYKEKGFNYSKIINYGVKNTKGDFVLQLNNDTQVITPNWLELFIGYAQRPEIGAVGARLLYPDKSIQHAGIVLGICGLAANALVGHPWGEHAYFGKEGQLQNVSAVTGACLFARRELYEEVGYMDEEKFAVAFNDVDFCLKIREKGYLNIYNPYIMLTHYESKTRGYDDLSNDKRARFDEEADNFKEKWKDVLSKPDPYYNRNFSRQTSNYMIDYENSNDYEGKNKHEQEKRKIDNRNILQKIVDGVEGFFLKIFRKIGLGKFADWYLEHQEGMRYLVFGALTTLVNILTYDLFYYAIFENTFWSNSVANAIAWIVGAVFAYITNKMCVFNSKVEGKKALLIEMISFFAARLVTFAFDEAIMIITVDKLHWNAGIMKIIANIIVIILNFVFSKLFVFKKGKKE